MDTVLVPERDENLFEHLTALGQNEGRHILTMVFITSL